MNAIFKREFKAFFQSMIGFVFIAANLFFIGIYYYAYNLNAGYPYFSYTLSSCMYIFMVTIPILTMRILTEDRKNKTDQLILTSPVSVTKIVLGKFLAVAAVFMIVVVIVSCYPLIMSLYGTVPFGETYGAIFGFILYGLAGISIGVFISSITENMIIAAVLSFGAMFVTYLMSGICSLISSDGNTLTTILGAFDLASRFDNFMNGSLEIASVVYFISVIVLMLFLTTQSIQKRRYSVSVKNLKMGAYSTGAIVVMIAAVVFVNLIVAKLPEKYTVFDITSKQLYSISDDTKEVLNNLDQDVDIYVYCAEDSFDTTTTEMLRRYEAASSHVTVTYVDPVSNPQFYKNYSTSTISSGSVIVTNGDKTKIISYNDLYETEYSMDYTTYQYTSEVTGYDGEGQITSAIYFVTNGESHVIYYTEGHGEQDLETSFTDVISKANVTYESLTLLNVDAVPDDAEALIINAPSGDFSEDDMNKVRDYLEKGGNVVLSFLTTGDATPVLYSFVEDYGLDVSNSIVMETDQNSYYQYPFYLLPDVGYSTLTSDIRSSYYIFAPYSIAMTVQDDLDDSLTVSRFLNTSENAYAKDLSSGEIQSYEKEDGDEEGTFTIGASITKDIDDETEAKLIVLASSTIFTASANQMVAGGNLKLFSNIISDLVNIETNVSIPVKSYDTEYLVLTQSNIALWRGLTMILLPVALLAIGFIIWLQRRKK